MFPVKLTQGISPWHHKCNSLENEQTQLKTKVIKAASIERSCMKSISACSERSTPLVMKSCQSSGFRKLGKRRLSNAGSEIDRLQRLHLPKAVSVKKPIEERKILEQVTTKEFIMLGEKVIQLYRRKQSFRSSFVIKHKLKREVEKENLNKKKS